MKKLIIFDFDGVIADTESTWVKIWHKHINQIFNLDWTYEKAYELFAGVSPQTKVERLNNLGYHLSKNDYDKIIAEEYENISKIKLTKGITDILSDKSIVKCVGTGGPTKKTAEKIEALKIREYLPNEIVFTAEMVKRGKPDPDVFLFAAEKMGYQPKDCLVIEDSIAGATAAITAKMDIIAFTEHQHLQREKYLETLRNLGVKKLVNTVEELKKFIYS